MSIKNCHWPLVDVSFKLFISSFLLTGPVILCILVEEKTGSGDLFDI
jgi:hypothetical protein